ncbi:MAG TPA: glycosyltransferase family 1 protein [Gammaproteobacteria bacterium]
MVDAPKHSRIAVMMRAMDQDSGHQSIIMGLVENMLREAPETSFLLLYRTPKFFGRFSEYPNAEEKLIRAPHKFLWDQVAVPYYAWKENASVIFNPKFSVPLVSHCPVVMGLHEPAWWTWPEHYEPFDRTYMKTMLPIYIKRSKHLFPISQFVVDECRKYIRHPFDNTTVTYPAPRSYIRRVEDPAALQRARAKYGLTEPFIFTLTRVDHPGLDNSRSFFPGKNVETTVRAFAQIRDEIPHELVIGGRRVEEFLLHRGFKHQDFAKIRFMDFIPHDELPAFLTLADLFVLPSFYESFAMSLVEAMTCGCPTVVSRTGACPEITAGAALMADPYSWHDFAEKMRLVLKDDELRAQLRSRALERASFFDWSRSAKRVLDAIGQVIEEARPPASAAKSPTAARKSPSGPPAGTKRA